MRNRITILVFIFAASFTLPLALAQANLLVMPVRIIFQDRVRTAAVTVVNTKNEEAVFRIDWKYQKQLADGRYEIVEGPIDPAHDPAKMIVYSPRQIVLPPQGKQRIRLSLRKPPDLPDGEYRIHMRFARYEGAHGNNASRRPKKNEGIVASVNINVGVAIPVIIRQGAYDAQVKISDPHFIPAPPDGRDRAKLDVTLSRTGKHGTIGRLKVYLAQTGMEEKEIGLLNNVNVFAETKQRSAQIPLSVPYVQGGVVRVVYEGDGPDKGIIFDEKSFPIGG